MSHETVCPDWVFCNNSNVHLAVDRGWFVSYVPFKSIVTTGLAGGLASISDGSLAVHGVGTVEIPVKIKDKVHRKLRLENVVHVPTYSCNILGGPILWNGHEVSMGSIRNGIDGQVKDSNGLVLGVLKLQHGLFCLALSGPPVGPVTRPSDFAISRPMGVGARWDPLEQQRWQNYQAQVQKASMTPASAGEQYPIDRYTPAETAWLKEHYGNEFKFLSSYQLSIHKEEDRTEGRAIVRALMEGDTWTGQSSDLKESGDEDEAKDSADEFLEDLETDPMSHLADYHFDKAELKAIKKHYRHSGNFMLSYGLKPFDDEDCKEAKQIAADMVEHNA